jgi:hypothetical protein
MIGLPDRRNFELIGRFSDPNLCFRASQPKIALWAKFQKNCQKFSFFQKTSDKFSFFCYAKTIYKIESFTWGLARSRNYSLQGFWLVLMENRELEFGEASVQRLWFFWALFVAFFFTFAILQNKQQNFRTLPSPIRLSFLSNLKPWEKD